MNFTIIYGTGAGRCLSVVIDVGVDAPVTLTLYAAGLRRVSEADVVVKIGSQTLPVRSIAWFDGSSRLSGVDQVHVGLPLTLRGSGEVDVVIVAGVSPPTPDGSTSKP